MSHTPGEYEAVSMPEGSAERWSVCIVGPGWHIATIENGAPGDSLETEKANAQLFASAPDLLAACEAMQSIAWMAREYADAGGSNSIEMQEYTAALTVLNNALAKAKGEAA